MKSGRNLVWAAKTSPLPVAVVASPSSNGDRAPGIDHPQHPDQWRGPGLRTEALVTWARTSIVLLSTSLLLVRCGQEDAVEIGKSCVELAVETCQAVGQTPQLVAAGSAACGGSLSGSQSGGSVSGECQGSGDCHFRCVEVCPCGIASQLEDGSKVCQTCVTQGSGTDTPDASVNPQTDDVGTTEEVTSSDDTSATADSGCTPDCSGRDCGSDGCGGVCGYCKQTTCSASGCCDDGFGCTYVACGDSWGCGTNQCSCDIALSGGATFAVNGHTHFVVQPDTNAYATGCQKMCQHYFGLSGTVESCVRNDSWFKDNDGLNGFVSAGTLAFFDDGATTIRYGAAPTGSGACTAAANANVFSCTCQ